MILKRNDLLDATTEEMKAFLNTFSFNYYLIYDHKKYEEFSELNSDFQTILKFFYLIKDKYSNDKYKELSIELPPISTSYNYNYNHTDMLINQNIGIFTLYNDKNFNTPLTFFYNFLNPLVEKYGREEIDKLLNGNLDAIYQNCHRELDKLNKKVYNRLICSLSPEMISYYSDVVKIYNFLLTPNNIDDFILIKYSVLLAIFLQESKDDKITTFDAIIDVWKEYGADIKLIFTILNIKIDAKKLDSIKNQDIILSDVEMLCKYLKQQLINVEDPLSCVGFLVHEHGDKARDNYHFEDVIRNFVGKNILAITKGQVNSSIESLELRRKHEKMRKAYGQLGVKEKDFIIYYAKAFRFFAKDTKTYSKDKEYSINLVESEDDAYILALFFAIHKYSERVKQFFVDYGIGMSEISSILKVDINRISRNIENEECVDYYLDKVVNFAIMSNPIAPEKLTIEDISLAIANASNPSRIINTIIQNLSQTGNYIDENFEEKLINFIEKEKIKELNDRRNSIFSISNNSISFSYIKVFENASQIYNTLKNTINILDEDLIPISLLISILINDRELKVYFEHIGISLEEIYKYYGIKEEMSLSEDDSDYEIIEEKFINYIDSDSNSITLINRIINSSGYRLNGLLNKFNLSHESFLNLEEKITNNLQEYKDQLEEEKNRSEFENYPSIVKKFIEDLLKIYKIINKINNKLLRDEKEKIKISILLTLLTNENHAIKYFNKYGITIKKVSELYQISLKEINERLVYTEPSYKYLSLFKPYICDFKTISSIANNLVENSDLELLNAICDYLNISLDILKREIIANTDIEDLSTLDEKIEMLLALNPNNININNEEAITKYGKALGAHSIYISNENIKLIQSYNIDKAFLEISDLLADVYNRTTTKKNSLIDSLRQKFKTVSKEPVTLDDINRINELIQARYNELDQIVSDYIKLRMYMGHYKTMNLEYLNTAMKLLEELKSGNLKSNNGNFKDLKSNSTEIFLRNKIANFNTSDELMNLNLLDITNRINAIYMKIYVLERAITILLPSLINYLSFHSDAPNTTNVTHNLIGLLQSSLNNDIEGLKNGIEMLSDLDIDDGTSKMLKDNTKDQISMLESKPSDSLSSTEDEIIPSSIETIQLTLNGQ